MTSSGEDFGPACDLGAFTSPQRARHRELIGIMRDRALDFETTGACLTLRYEPDGATFLALAEWITLERLCCPRFRFSLAQEPDGGQVRLRVEGAAAEHLAPG